MSRRDLPPEHDGILGNVEAVVAVLRMLEGERVYLSSGYSPDGNLLQVAGPLRFVPDDAQRSVVLPGATGTLFFTQGTQFKIGDGALLSVSDAAFEHARLLTFDDNDFFKLTIRQAGTEVVISDEGSAP